MRYKINLHRVALLLLAIIFCQSVSLYTAQASEVESASQISDTLVSLIDNVFTGNPAYQIVDQNGIDCTENVIDEYKNLYESGDYESISSFLLSNEYVFTYDEIEETVSEQETDVPYSTLVTKDFSKWASRIIDLREYGGKLAVLSYKVTGTYTYNSTTSKITKMVGPTVTFSGFDGGTGFSGTANNVTTSNSISSDKLSGTFKVKFSFVVTDAEPQWNFVIAQYTFGPFTNSFTVTAD
jgi:hypothetical protein